MQVNRRFGDARRGATGRRSASAMPRRCRAGTDHAL